MRISDWSSDVCSSDLLHMQESPAMAHASVDSASFATGDSVTLTIDQSSKAALSVDQPPERSLWASLPFCMTVLAAEIGRASCRERVCQYVEISVVAVSLKNKKTSKHKSPHNTK